MSMYNFADEGVQSATTALFSLQRRGCTIQNGQGVQRRRRIHSQLSTAAPTSPPFIRHRRRSAPLQLTAATRPPKHDLAGPKPIRRQTEKPPGWVVFCLAPQVGLEPTTPRLTGDRGKIPLFTCFPNFLVSAFVSKNPQII